MMAAKRIAGRDPSATAAHSERTFGEALLAAGYSLLTDVFYKSWPFVTSPATDGAIINPHDTLALARCHSIILCRHNLTATLNAYTPTPFFSHG